MMVFYLSALLNAPETADLRGCGYRKNLCNLRPNILPCPRRLVISGTPKPCHDCLDHKWKALCEVEGTVKCAGTPNCVLPQWILDGKDDCGDGSDEEPCRLLDCVPPTPLSNETTTTVVKPSGNSFQRVTGTVIKPSEIPVICNVGEFRCLSGECVDGQLVLDGKPNCFDKSDEEYCQRYGKYCTAASPCSFHTDIMAFGCGCPKSFVRDERGICRAKEHMK